MVVACFYLAQFGLACERARLPHLVGQPLALLGDDGLLTVCSDETNRFGVRPGQTQVAAKALCPGLFTLPYDRTTYEEFARPLWDLYAVESSIVEPISPELCYVAFEGRDIRERVSALASAVSSRIATTVQVGIGTSKFIALQAAKRVNGKLLAVPVGSETAFLGSVSVDMVPGLERKVRQRLDRLGIKTFGDIGKLPASQLHRLGRDVGPILYRFSRGLDGDHVRALWPPRAIERTIAFDDETADEPTIHNALNQVSEEIANELSRSREYCRSITLTVGFADRTYRQEQERLVKPVSNHRDILRAALRLLNRTKVEQEVLELILAAADIGIGSATQLALIDANAHALGLPHERGSRLEAVLRFLRKRYPASAPVSCRLLKQSKKTAFWTYSLGHALMMPVEVFVDRKGQPVKYRGLRHRQIYEREIRSILTRWKECDWSGEAECEVWRVEADEYGLCDLTRLGVEWRLSSVAD